MTSTLLRGKQLPAPPREQDFTSPLRDERFTARVGTALGIAFTICFLTGILSHELHATTSWLPLPSRPFWGYRVTQGLHVLSGIAAIPLLLVKLWGVFPKLFGEIPFHSAKLLVFDLLEKASIAVLVASSIFQLASGLANTSQWYPWGFSFRSTHYAMAYVSIGALVVHIAVKLPVIRRALGVPLTGPEPDQAYVGPSRRALLRTTWVASAVAVLAAAGQSVPLLRHVSVFGVRDGNGPQALPINKSARAAGVTATAVDPAFRLILRYRQVQQEMTISDLEAMTQRTATLPIACVEGWSADASWTGIRMSDLMDVLDVPRGAVVKITSLQASGPFRVTLLPANFAADPLTMLALRLNGERLAIDHGYPCRIIAPNRPGVLQTKWVTKLEFYA